jgi:hypothetical protein
VERQTRQESVGETVKTGAVPWDGSVGTAASEKSAIGREVAIEGGEGRVGRRVNKPPARSTSWFVATGGRTGPRIFASVSISSYVGF